MGRAVRLYRVDLERQLNAPAYRRFTAILHPGGSLHPDGIHLFYGANLIYRGKPIEATWIYRHNLQTDERTPIAARTSLFLWKSALTLRAHT